jgi:nucleoside-diphosphate-sugar epimerase
LISRECTLLAARRGIELHLLNRGQRQMDLSDGVRTIAADIRGDRDALAAVLSGQTFDAVVNFIAFTAADVLRDIELFRGRCGQYVFISSASAYQKPIGHYLITESTPLANPYWQYSRDKIDAEEALNRAWRESGFPITIVRPSLTYDRTMIPHVIGSWNKPWTIADRILNRRPLVVPGDGTSLWVITHSRDFAKGLIGLLGNSQAIGHAFHITTDEVHTWDGIYKTVGVVLGVEPVLVHVPTDLIVRHNPAAEGGLRGDKSCSVVFDNTKIKRFVPDFAATILLRQGVEESVAWYRADSTRQAIDEGANRNLDALAALADRMLV